MTNKTQVNLRLPADVIQKLKKEAEKQKRTVNNLLEVIIGEYLENREENIEK